MLLDTGAELLRRLHLPLLLRPGHGHGLLHLPAQGLPVGMLTLQTLTEPIQILHAAAGALLLGGQSRLLRFLLRQHGGQPAQLLPAVCLSLLLPRHLLPNGFRPGFIVRDGLPDGIHAAHIVGAALAEILTLDTQTFGLVPQAVEQNVKVVFAALQCQHPVIGLPLLLPGHLQLILGLLQLPVGALGHQGGILQLAAHLAQLFIELLQLPGTGEDAGAAADAAAGHGAAGVDDLAVQGDDAEAVVVALGHPNAAVQVLHHHGCTQQVPDDAAIAVFIAHQLRGDAHKAVFVLQTALPQAAAPDGVQRQEGGPAAVPLFQ